MSPWEYNVVGTTRSPVIKTLSIDWQGNSRIAAFPIHALKGVIPLVPYMLLFAISNACGEEMLYRAPWLSALEKPVGATQAVLITATYFGTEHFYGVPCGIMGVIMALIPGRLIGKAVLETRGSFGPGPYISGWM